MNAQKALFAALALIVLAVTVIPYEAGAVPAFARRHKISCTTCHDPFPRLKEFGAEFAGNGFVIPEDEKDRDYVIAGDELLRLNRDFPVAGRFDAYGVWDDAGDVDTDLQTPWGVKLISGGALAENVGYYYYFYLSERGEVAGIEDAIVHFNNVFGSELDVAVGQFQTSDPLMKRELRLTFDDYLAYKTKVGDSHVNLTYDRGLMLGYGIEATGTDLIATITNGNGKAEADEMHRFDEDARKNVGLRLSQGVGEHLSVGGYFYTGGEGWSEFDDTGVLVGTMANDITWYGPDLSLSLGPAVLTAQYLLREDSSPLLDGTQTDVKTEGIVAELVLQPRGPDSRHIYTLLYNRIDSDLNALDYESFTCGATYLMARNVRLLVEFTRDLSCETNRAVVGTVTAF
ncbi:hypothetical protein H8E07_11880 [bacterium]|nr:hypothetical protein [bacterium]